MGSIFVLALLIYPENALQLFLFLRLMDENMNEECEPGAFLKGIAWCILFDLLLFGTWVLFMR